MIDKTKSARVLFPATKKTWSRRLGNLDRGPTDGGNQSGEFGSLIGASGELSLGGDGCSRDRGY